MKRNILVLGIILIVFCGNPVNEKPNSPEEYSYAPLHVGNMYQLASLPDSIISLTTVIGKKVRKDNKEVFVEVDNYGKYSDTFYSFIDDGFYQSCAFDTVFDSVGGFDTLNPFQEDKICLEKPTLGYFWLNYYHDFNSYSYVDNFTTYAGKFNNVFIVERYYYDSKCILFMKNYYGENIGLIGAEFINSTGAPMRRFLLTYAKINGIECGHLWPNRKATKPVPPFGKSMRCIFMVNKSVHLPMLRGNQ